jgi:hypothetical protein
MNQQKMIRFNNISKTSGKIIFKSERKERSTSFFTTTDDFVIRMMIKNVYPTLEEHQYGENHNKFGLNIVKTLIDDPNIRTIFQQTSLEDIDQRRFSSALTHIKPLVARYDINSELRSISHNPSSQWTKSFAPMFYSWMTQHMIRSGKNMFESPSSSDFDAVLTHSYNNGYTTFGCDINQKIYVKSKYLNTVLTIAEMENITIFIKSCRHTDCCDEGILNMPYLGRLRNSSEPPHMVYYLAFIGEIFNKLVHEKRIRATIVVDNFYDVFDSELVKYLLSIGNYTDNSIRKIHVPTIVPTIDNQFDMSNFDELLYACDIVNECKNSKKRLLDNYNTPQNKKQIKFENNNNSFDGLTKDDIEILDLN